jgi:hypothetical protein
VQAGDFLTRTSIRKSVFCLAYASINNNFQVGMILALRTFCLLDWLSKILFHLT